MQLAFKGTFAGLTIRICRLVNRLAAPLTCVILDFMETKNRLVSIDAFRGFAIVGMVLVNYLAGVAWIPAIVKHAPDVGLTLADLVAPFFIFAIGLTYGLSARKRIARDGWSSAAGYFVRRWLAIIGIGALITAGETWFGENTAGVDWGVLQAIGVAGLITLAVIRLKSWQCGIIGLAVLVVYQVLLDNFWLSFVLHSPHGGLPGAVDWAGMMILATVLADLFHDAGQGRHWFPWASLAVLAAGAALALVVPVSKNRVSSTYVLITLAISALVFWLFYWLMDRSGVRLKVLEAWGKNPIVLYCLHLVLLGPFVLPGIVGWYAQAPGWLVTLQALALCAALSSIALWFEKKGWIISV
jgi:predicted acyltransferase